MVSSQEMLSDELYVASIAEVYSVVVECDRFHTNFDKRK